MADILEGLPVRTLNNGLTDPAEVTVGVLDSGGALITPAKEGGNLLSIKTKTDNLDVLLSTRATEATQLLQLTQTDFDAKIALVATEATLGTRLSQSDFDTKIALVAQDATLTSGSQKSKIVSGSGTVLVIDANGTAATLLKDSAGATLIGQKVMASSLPVTLASDQSTINVNVMSSVATAPVADYNTSAALAAGASNTHTYTSVATNNLILQGIHGSSSGLLKIEVKIGPAGTEVTKAVGFNSTANPNIDINLYGFKVPAGQNVLVIRTNRESAKAQDVYSTVLGENV